MHKIGKDYSHKEVQYGVSDQNIEKWLPCAIFRRETTVRLYTPVNRKSAQNAFRKQNRDPEMVETKWGITPGTERNAGDRMGKH